MQTNHIFWSHTPAIKGTPSKFITLPVQSVKTQISAPWSPFTIPQTHTTTNKPHFNEYIKPDPIPTKQWALPCQIQQTALLFHFPVPFCAFPQPLSFHPSNWRIATQSPQDGSLLQPKRPLEYLQVRRLSLFFLPQTPTYTQCLEMPVCKPYFPSLCWHLSLFLSLLPLSLFPARKPMILTADVVRMHRR